MHQRDRISKFRKYKKKNEEIELELKDSEKKYNAINQNIKEIESNCQD